MYLVVRQPQICEGLTSEATEQLQLPQACNSLLHQTMAQFIVHPRRQRTCRK